MVLVSTSKSGAEVAHALTRVLTPDETTGVVGWLNAGGALRGTPLADDAASPPNSWVTRSVFWIAGWRWDGLTSMMTGPSRKRLEGARLPLDRGPQPGGCARIRNGQGQAHLDVPDSQSSRPQRRRGATGRCRVARRRQPRRPRLRSFPDCAAGGRPRPGPVEGVGGRDTAGRSARAGAVAGATELWTAEVEHPRDIRRQLVGDAAMLLDQSLQPGAPRLIAASTERRSFRMA